MSELIERLHHAYTLDPVIRKMTTEAATRITDLETQLAAALAGLEEARRELVAWNELVTMAHINRDGLWPNNWPQNVAWIAHCLHTNSLPPTLIDAATKETK